jgi:hypothetical protein
MQQIIVMYECMNSENFGARIAANRVLDRKIWLRKL